MSKKRPVFHINGPFLTFLPGHSIKSLQRDESDSENFKNKFIVKSYFDTRFWFKCPGQSNCLSLFSTISGLRKHFNWNCNCRVFFIYFFNDESLFHDDLAILLKNPKHVQAKQIMPHQSYVNTLYPTNLCFCNPWWCGYNVDQIFKLKINLFYFILDQIDCFWKHLTYFWLKCQLKDPKQWLKCWNMLI